MTEKKNGEQILALIASTYANEETTNSLEDTGIVVWKEHHNVNELTKFGTLIFSPMSTKDLGNDNAVVERAIIRILEDGGHVCILLDVESSKDTVINDILLAASTKLIPFSTPVVETNVKRSEFTEFLRKYGIVSNMIRTDKDVHSVICTTRYVLANEYLQDEATKYDNQAVVGLTIKKEKGLLTLLPFHGYFSVRGQEIKGALLELSKALETHRKNLFFRPPSWITSICLKDEERLKVQTFELQNELESKLALLDEQLRMKSILWLKHADLVDALRAVLKFMRINTKVNDIGEEDFWILDDAGLEIIICESKGKDSNLTRSDINDLDTHREARKKGPTFPALLLVNSFNKAQSVEEKDVPIPSNVIEHAVNLNIPYVLLI